jgi:hypothetical protein
MSIAGQVSRAMLSCYSNVRMDAKRRALDEIAARQRAADKKRKGDSEQQRLAALASRRQGFTDGAVGSIGCVRGRYAVIRPVECQSQFDDMATTNIYRPQGRLGATAPKVRDADYTSKCRWM